MRGEQTMRCPYCGGYNRDDATFCKNCGRDMSMPPVPAPPRQQQPQPPQRSPYQPQQPQPPQRSSYPPQQRPSYPPPQPPRPATPVQAPSYRQPAPTYQPPQQPPPRSPQPPQNGPGTYTPRHRVPAPPPAPLAPPAPEPPAPFPPRTIEQLRALEQGALPYTLVREDISNGRKQVIRIAYSRCTGWQQVATLLKAFRERQSDKYETVVLQGVLEQEGNSVYNFTNGQLVFDRDVRLGSQILKRYQIETGNGYANDSVRIVLSE